MAVIDSTRIRCSFREASKTVTPIDPRCWRMDQRFAVLPFSLIVRLRLRRARGCGKKPACGSVAGLPPRDAESVRICSYYRDIFSFPESLKTLEYLIRRYKIYFYNIEELVLCVLPYHDIHVFV